MPGIARIPRSGGAPQPVVAAQDPLNTVLANSTLFYLDWPATVDSTRPWILDLKSVSTQGGTPMVLLHGLIGPLATDGDNVYWGTPFSPFEMRYVDAPGIDLAFGRFKLSDQSVKTLPLDAGEKVNRIALGADAVYFSTFVGSPFEGRIRRVPKDYSQVTTIVRVQAVIDQMAVDGSAVYFCDTRPPSPVLTRVNLDGTNPVPLATLDRCDGLAVGANAVYVASFGTSVNAGRVAKIAKTGGCEITVTAATAPSDLTLYGGSVYFWEYNQVEVGRPPLEGRPIVTPSIMATLE